MIGSCSDPAGAGQGGEVLWLTGLRSGLVPPLDAPVRGVADVLEIEWLDVPIAEEDVRQVDGVAVVGGGTG